MIDMTVAPRRRSRRWLPRKGSATAASAEGRRRRLLGPNLQDGHDQRRDGDKGFEQRGAHLVVDRKSFLYLNGTILDYKDELMSAGCRLQQPNVKRSCGCGSSFIV